MTTTEENKTIVTDFIGALFTKGDLDAVDDFLAEDFVNNDPPFGASADREGMRTAGAMFRSVFPDWHSDLHLLVAEGDLVVELFTATGTHTGSDLMGVAATGRSVRLPGINIFRIEGGRIASAGVVSTTSASSDSWASSSDHRPSRARGVAWLSDRLGIGRIRSSPKRRDPDRTSRRRELRPGPVPGRVPPATAGAAVGRRRLLRQRRSRDAAVHLGDGRGAPGSVDAAVPRQRVQPRGRQQVRHPGWGRRHDRLPRSGHPRRPLGQRPLPRRPGPARPRRRGEGGSGLRWLVLGCALPSPRAVLAGLRRRRARIAQTPGAIHGPRPAIERHRVPDQPGTSSRRRARHHHLRGRPGRRVHQHPSRALAGRHRPVRLARTIRAPCARTGRRGSRRRPHPGHGPPDPTATRPRGLAHRPRITTHRTHSPRSR